MAHRIIVACDGSDMAREAFALSVTIAAATRATILGLHVLELVPPPIIAESIAGVDAAPALAEFDESARRDEQAERARFAREFDDLERACAERGVPFERAIEVGLLIPALVGLAGGDDIIAIGMKGRFARGGLGSSTKSLIKKAPCPVLIASGPARPINRVLAVFDGSTVSKRALAEAQRWAEESGWPLAVLAVSNPDATLDETLDQAHRLAGGATVVTADAEGRTEAEQIETAAQHTSESVIVMGAYPDSWLHQLFFGFGGTTAHVLSHVGAPVLIMH